MTDKLRAAAAAALERLEHLEFNKPHVRGTDDCHEDIIEEIRAVLDEPEVEQEPTAWCWVSGGLRGPVYHGSGPDADIAARAAAAETPRTVQYLWDGPPLRRAALAEPVAWADEIIEALQVMYDTEGILEDGSGDALIRLNDAIGAVEDAEKRHPPRREWQGLTRTEMLKLANEAAPPEDVLWVRDPDQALVAVARAVEVALRERNT